jgi:hypothetical protein
MWGQAVAKTSGEQGALANGPGTHGENVATEETVEASGLQPGDCPGESANSHDEMGVVGF